MALALYKLFLYAWMCMLEEWNVYIADAGFVCMAVKSEKEKESTEEAVLKVEEPKLTDIPG
ncbi:MAG TPA: hypothetical protein VJK51_03270, partial [Candidatus Nanoarchaeia archaeon]|nr:hypothetical protein [Candidatus Nanoarchaeia archaeon]